jgi:hypothetical protein
MQHLFVAGVFEINRQTMEENKVLSVDEKNWAMLCHLSGLIGFYFPLGGIIGSILLWSSKKAGSAWVDQNGKNAVNFNLSILLYSILSIPLMFIVIGFFIVGILVVLKIVCIIIASISAAKGEHFKYPLTIPFIQ